MRTRVRRYIERHSFDWGEKLFAASLLIFIAVCLWFGR